MHHFSSAVALGMLTIIYCGDTKAEVLGDGRMMVKQEENRMKISLVSLVEKLADNNTVEFLASSVHII